MCVCASASEGERKRERECKVATSVQARTHNTGGHFFHSVCDRSLALALTLFYYLSLSHTHTLNSIVASPSHSLPRSVAKTKFSSQRTIGGCYASAGSNFFTLNCLSLKRREQVALKKTMMLRSIFVVKDLAKDDFSL